MLSAQGGSQNKRGLHEQILITLETNFFRSLGPVYVYPQDRVTSKILKNYKTDDGKCQTIFYSVNH